ncbi:MAG: exonuclease domain-containing protein [Ktedonobacterales bacterium]
MSTEYSVWCSVCDFPHNRPSGQIEHPREKRCEICGETKPLSGYARNSGSWDGHRKVCLPCAATEKAKAAAHKAQYKAIEQAKPLAGAQGDAHAATGRYGRFAEMTTEQVAVWARGALKRPTLRIVDTETTGHGGDWDGGVDEIVEICILDGNGAVLLNTLVMPRDTMNPDATAKSGITDAMLATCAPFSAIAEQVRKHLDGMDVVIYNAAFDTERIAEAFMDCGQAAPTYQSRCAMQAYKRISGRATWVSLEAACRGASIAPRDVHRALGDCLSTLALLRHMAEQAPIGGGHSHV